ncbi:MAG: TIR domain-containing protein [Desulfobacteraceae bacterium]|nr:TIR domain-containing protein [Desulfobacteraceae bacterium]
MANKEHLEILKQGVEIWNRWREDNPDVKPDLQEAYLKDVNLYGANFTEADLQKANFAEADLQKANFTEADLQKANFIEADLQHANLQKTKLQGAKLTRANLWESNLQRAKLQGAKLTWASLEDATLMETNLQESNFKNANLEKANLWGANLYKSSFWYANLQNVDLREANLWECSLWGANLKGADLRKANLWRANFKGADLQKVDLRGAKIDKGTFNVFSSIFLNNIEIMEIDNNELLLIKQNENLITRSIEFPPEYRQAGISILNYFGTVLRKKYPDCEAKIRIEQDGLRVTMIIDPVKGDREVIEKVLDEYGLVVTGKMLLEDYTDDRLLKIELENKLALAKIEVENQKRLLQYQDEQLKDKSEESAKKDIQIDRLLSLLESGLKSEAKEQDAEVVKVFISCAEDDMLTANKIYADLQKEGILTPWVSHKDINAGEKTEFAVRRAIKNSDYFLALLSSSSVNEKGAFQKELKQAFDTLAEFPQGNIFIIPVRLDDCNTNNEALSEMHIIDLHKTSWNSGLERIVQTMRQKE